MVRSTTGRPARLGAVRRDEERVTPLELFFDLVFVLAIARDILIRAREALGGMGH